MARDKREQCAGRRLGAAVLQARPGGPAERFADAHRPAPPAAVFFAALFSALRGAGRGCRSLLGLVVTHVLAHARRPRRAPTTSAIARARHGAQRRSSTTPSAVGSTVGGAPVLPILVGLVAIVCAFAAPLAHRRLRGLRARRRVGDLPRHVARRPARAPVRARGSRTCPANASYPSGHTAASIAVYAGLVLLLTSGDRQPRRCASPPGRWRSCCRSSSRCRGCTAACTIRSTSPAALLVGVGAIAGRCCSPAAPRGRRRARPRGRSAVARPRPHAGGVMKVAVVAHAEKTLGGGLAGAAPRARRPRASPTRSGTRCRRPSGRPTQVAPRARRGRGARLRLGRRRHRPPLHRRARRHATRASPSSPPARRTSSRRTSASRRTSSSAVAIGLARRAPAARRRPLRRRALRASWPASASTPR